MPHDDSHTRLPPVRRTKRRDWGRLVARILCVAFALIALVPIGVGALVRTRWARSLATAEATRVLAGLGVKASFALEIRIWPLSVAATDLRVEASDGGAPFLTAKSVAARPRIFGLLAGKVVLDQIEIDEPKARVVLKDGKLGNLALDLPKSKDDGEPAKLPFSVVSTSGAEIDLDVDGRHLNARDIDADVSVEDDGSGETALEVALRVEEARTRTEHDVAAKDDRPGWHAVDDDTLCRLDARARIEKTRILVRRLSLHGSADLDREDGTYLGCGLPKNDKRYVELALGHLAVVLPTRGAKMPAIDGHVRVRAPLDLLQRIPNAPDAEGWVSVDAEAHYGPDTQLPDVSGRIEGGGVRVVRFSFARTLETDFAIRHNVVTVDNTVVAIADGIAEVHGVEIRPLEKTMPVKIGRLDVRELSFFSLMRDFHVSPHPHVTWDVKELHATDFHGTADPLHVDADLVANTANFAVYDAGVDNPVKERVIGVTSAHLLGKIGIRPQFLEFQNIQVTTPHSLVQGVLVGIGYHEAIKVEVPTSHIDIGDVAPIGKIAMAGVMDAKVTITGQAANPHLEGETSITNFVIGEIPFGNVTQAKVTADIDALTVDLRDVHATKGKSQYEMPTGRLNFKGPASMQLDGHATSKNLGLRDFFSMFKLDEDPRLDDIDGTLATNAQIHIALGGPEDACQGGYIAVQATADGRDLKLLNERFAEGHVELEYRWLDRLAGMDGAEVDVRSLSLTKARREGKTAVGTILGSLGIRRGGELRGSLVVEGYPLGRTNLLGDAATLMEGSISGVARIGGTMDAFDIEADLNATPVRIAGMPFGGSDLHFAMNQTPGASKIVGRTPCGAPISAPFDKEAFQKDTSSQGDLRLDGALFGGQVKLDGLTMTRQRAPVFTGRVELARFDLGPIGKVLRSADEVDPTAPTIGGEMSGELLLDRVASGDIAHARARFSPRALVVTRGGQRLQLRPSPAEIVLASDEIEVPKMTFDITADNGLKGTIAASGAIRKVTSGGDLALQAELAPIDLGILVGIAPRVTRAVGTLSGSIKVMGDPQKPDFQGQAQVRGGDFTVKGVPGTISNVEVDATADENEARITRAVGRFLGGDVGLTGRMPLKGGAAGVLEAAVTGRQLYVAPVDGVKATVDADLQVTLNPAAATPAGRLPFVGGEVAITSFEYTRPITIDLTGLKGGAKRTIVEAYDPSLDAVNLGIDVRSKAPLRIRNNLVDAQLAIDPRGVHVSGTNQRIGLRGEMVALPGGHFRVFANDFELQKGEIRFDDATKIAPHVNFLATTEYRRYTNTLSGGAATTGTTTSGSGAAGTISSSGSGSGLWRISLHAYGDTEDLKVDMTSDPALSSEDIFFLLTIGLTRAEVDQVRAGSVYASAAFEAIGTVSGADRAVKTAIPVIDDFRFGSAYSPLTGRTEPQVTIGRRLTRDVRANVSTGLTEDRQLRANVEWRLSRPLSLQTSYDNISTVSSGSFGNVGFDVRWRLEFN